MKKFLAWTLVCLLFCGMTTGALANQWGLRGGIYDIVCEDETYDSYSADADDGSDSVKDRYVNHAILSSRYHSQLIAASRNGKVWQADVRSTTAVYQPEDPRGLKPDLMHTGDGFALCYGDRERFVFTEYDGQYVLTFAMLEIDTNRADSLIWQDGEGYMYWQCGTERESDPTGDAMWLVDAVTLDAFNIEQIPRSMADVRRMNSVSAALREGVADFTDGLEQTDVTADATDWNGAGKGVKLPVYSAPTEDSYRASSGKASVSTSGSMKLLGEFGGWTMVEYEVSARTSRIGYVHASLMETPVYLNFADPDPMDMTDPDGWGVPLQVVCNTFLTDDPHVSQYEQAELCRGYQVKGLAAAGDFYAYVAAEVNGETYWGFVPLRDLEPVTDRSFPHPDRVRLYSEFCWSKMDTLIGKWDRMDGMALGCERMVLMSNGSYVLYDRDDTYQMLQIVDVGSWRIIEREPGRDYAAYALPKYELLLVNEANEALRFGMVHHADGALSLVTEDDSAVYERYEYSTYGNG